MKSYLEMSNDEFGEHYYNGNRERVTLDAEWSESELKDNVWDDCNQVLKEWLVKNSNKPVYNKDLLSVDYLAEQVCNENDVIEVYNKEYDKHRNDEEKLFGVAYFDNWCKAHVRLLLKANLVLPLD